VIKNLIFDFDGVILDSVPVKTEAFRKLFNEFNRDSVDELIDYHLQNGGKPRYLKIRYFFEKILHQTISDSEVLEYADRYSELTKEELSKSKYLIEDTMNFIKNNFKNYNLHVASGADENDLKYICTSLDLNRYFLSIHGSPTLKNILVNDILKNNNYQKRETILIGDSLNDYDAAKQNDIEFYGFNNEGLKNNFSYIDSFNNITFME
jgi:phosphoglycolate phosphatase-like HAD superfamily hydrolase